MTPERIAELRAFINKPGLSGTEGVYIAQIETSDCLDTIESQQRRIEELEAALKPFADAMNDDDAKVKRLGLPVESNDCPQYWKFCFGTLRVARTALQPKEPS